MAKRKAAKLTAGMTVRVREGTTMPEFAHLSIAGWMGKILETQGKGAAQKAIVQWDDDSISRMPNDYRAHCESQGLFHGMACLPISDLQIVES